MKKLICGFGINDVGGATTKHPEEYKLWVSVIQRCYGQRTDGTRLDFKRASVCKEWLRFSGFLDWVRNQDRQGKQLDKDLLSYGDKIYSPETCVFIDPSLNNFLRDGRQSRDLPSGVRRNGRKFFASITPHNRTCQEYLGSFDTAEKAHRAWKREKHKCACELAKQQKDPRVASALSLRYL